MWSKRQRKRIIWSQFMQKALQIMLPIKIHYKKKKLLKQKPNALMCLYNNTILVNPIHCTQYKSINELTMQCWHQAESLVTTSGEHGVSV